MVTFNVFSRDSNVKPRLNDQTFLSNIVLQEHVFLFSCFSQLSIQMVFRWPMFGQTIFACLAGALEPLAQHNEQYHEKAVLFSFYLYGQFFVILPYRLESYIGVFWTKKKTNRTKRKRCSVAFI